MERARRAIAETLAVFAQGQPSAEQLGDLADALDAYADRRYGVARALAEGSQHRRAIARGRRPRPDKTLEELRLRYARLC